MRLPLRAVLAVTALVAGGLAQSGAAAAEPSGAAAPDTRQCRAAGEKGLRCVEVSASLDRKIAVGQEAALSVSLKSLADLAGTRVEIELPAGLEWASKPSGFDVARRAPANPADGRSISRATRAMDLDRGSPARITARVKAVDAGDLAIRVRVLPPAGYGLGAERSVLLTAGPDTASSRLGLAEGPYGVRKLPDGTKTAPLTRLPSPKLSDRGLARPHSDDKRPGDVSAQAISCVRGSFVYDDAAGAQRPAANLQVQVWDSDTFSDDLLTVGLTDGNGAYRLCFDNEGDGGGGQDVYLNFVTQNGQWGVEWDDDPYTFETETRDNVGDGTTTDFGVLTSQDRRLQRALRAYGDADAASAFTPGDCWDARDRDCRRIDINWAPGEDPDTEYRGGEDEVYLLDQDADDRNVVVHEIGHAVMDDVYDDDYPDTGSGCRDHEMHKREATGCAWSEGFGDWYGVAVFGDPVYRDTVDQTIAQSVDSPTWGSNRTDNREAWENGDGVEGRVAGALWDLVDTAVEQPWDVFGEGFDPVWNTFLDHRSSDFRQYWTQRGQDGRNVGPQALSSLFQNTIDYDFRDPLTNHQSKERPTPTGTDHNYRFDTTRVFWSVTALRPPAAADYDLRLYDDGAMSTLLASSTQAAGVTDFVAVNSNRRALGDYYPRVHPVSGSGDYRIEADETEGVFDGTPTVTMGAGRLAAVWDVCLPAGERATYTVTPSNASQDAELFVLSAESGGADHVFTRAAAVATGSAHGPGAAESVTVDLPEGCHGLVVVNRAGSGTYTVAKS